MKLKHERNMYPPRVKMTVSIYMNNPDPFTLPVKFLGCEGTSDDKLDVELTLPLGKHKPKEISLNQMFCHGY